MPKDSQEYETEESQGNVTVRFAVRAGILYNQAIQMPKEEWEAFKRLDRPTAAERLAYMIECGQLTDIDYSDSSIVIDDEDFEAVVVYDDEDETPQYPLDQYDADDTDAEGDEDEEDEDEYV